MEITQSLKRPSQDTRPKSASPLLLLVTLDIAGLALSGMGVWRLQFGTLPFVFGSPISASEAGIAIGVGFTLLFLMGSRLSRELRRSSVDKNNDREPNRQ
ncbi:MAG: hypothetical protein LBU46_07595 [Candidatus Accumulibacter sp.]|jgi:hypothetical protein|nr:hypothetical protein [Accumulibacter sp.]